MAKKLIMMRNIIKRYYIGQPNELQILNGINLDIHEGEFVSIVGASGSGKSTLMNMIGALDKPTEGSYFQTENQYQALVYYREPGGRTDLLVGYQQVHVKF